MGHLWRSGWMGSWVVLALSLSSTAAWAWHPFVVGGRCVGTGASCRTTLGETNQNGCCSPRSPDVVSCARSSPCSGGAWVRWPARAFPLRWYLVEQGMAGKAGFVGISADRIEGAAKDAWASWEAPPCTSFRQQYGGRISRYPDSRDGTTVVYLATEAEWAQIGLGTAALAFSVPTQGQTLSELVDGDIVVSPSTLLPWGVAPVPDDRVDLAAVLQHEVGHSLGFGHSEDTTATMYYTIRDYGQLFTALPKDDQDAICAMYPASLCQGDAACGACGRCVGGRCEPIPAPSATTCRACQNDAVCGAGQTCATLWYGGRCVPRCEDGCCPEGMRCHEAGGIKRCLPLTGSCDIITCNTNAACGNEGRCEAGRCRSTTQPTAASCHRSCVQDTDCSATERCVELTSTMRRCVSFCLAGSCSQGMVCHKMPQGELCLPEDPRLCPCREDSACPSGEVCKQGFCQKSDGNDALDACSDLVSCREGMVCLRLSGSPICVNLCGEAARVALGSGGAPCSLGACESGLRCLDIPQVGALCLKPCSEDSDCGAGSCRLLGQQKVCLCQGDAQCAAGEACQTSFLRALQSGACGRAIQEQGCPPGESCQVLTPGLSVCSPPPPPPPQNRQIGESCSPQSPCASGLVCVEGTKGSFCFERCTEGLPCLHGGICIRRRGGFAQCICNADNQCPADRFCKELDDQAFACVCRDPDRCARCGDGLCDPNRGENCDTCPQDCGCTSPQRCFNGRCQLSCGNGFCERGEDCQNCPQDCSCPSGQNCENGRCSLCGNGNCDLGEDCTTCPLDCVCPSRSGCVLGRCVPATCGNLRCEPQENENCQNCPEDCACYGGESCQGNRCVLLCGDGRCEAARGENCTTCPDDCACPSGRSCVQGVCGDGCGDGRCDARRGENCATCPQDCGCPAERVCHNNSCQSIAEICRGEGEIVCETGQKNCRAACVPKLGCMCQGFDSPEASLPFLIVLLLLMFSRIRRRERIAR